MNKSLQKLNKLADYDNVLITDDKGIIVFYDVADLQVLKELGSWPEDIIGKHVTMFHKNLTDETSTIMNVLRNGQAMINVKQDMITRLGYRVHSISSTFPIKNGKKLIGAIEFSNRFYDKENIQSLEKKQTHKIYRKNNTVYTIDDLITQDQSMLAVKDRIRTISQTNSTVLIYGKTGTGKEIVAQAIHNLSNRYPKPYVSLNCSAIPESLMESTLFGTVKGSFTGAEDMPGIFEQADGGTLFLDEINSLAIHLQVKLLKAIEEKQIRRVGGTKNIQVDIKLISAMNEDPVELIKQKKLREDLFYRLSVVQLNLPELKDRPGDIDVLTTYFIDFFNENMNMSVRHIEPEVMECFRSYTWPGNVRELKNAIETAYNHISSNKITIKDIPERIRQGIAQPMSPLPSQVPIPKASLKNIVESYEKHLITEALQSTHGNITEAAKQLNTSKQSLYYKIEKYKLR